MTHAERVSKALQAMTEAEARYRAAYAEAEGLNTARLQADYRLSLARDGFTAAEKQFAISMSNRRHAEIMTESAQVSWISAAAYAGEILGGDRP